MQVSPQITYASLVVIQLILKEVASQVEDEKEVEGG